MVMPNGLFRFQLIYWIGFPFWKHLVSVTKTQEKTQWAVGERTGPAVHRPGKRGTNTYI